MLQYYFTLSLLVIILSQANIENNQALRQKMVEDAIQCQKKVDASSDDMDFLLNIGVPKNRKEACLANCFFSTMGIMHPNGTMVIDKALGLYEMMKDEMQEHYNTFDLRTSMEHCNQKQSSEIKDSCDATKEYLICITKTYDDKN